MKYVRKTYVEFLYSGVLFSESSTKEVNTRDVSKLKVPKNAFCFKFFDILSMVVDVDDEEVELISQRINVSPTYYYGGTVYTVAELKLAFPNEHTLIRNIESDDCQRAIKCRTGNWRPFKETDILVDMT